MPNSFNSVKILLLLFTAVAVVPTAWAFNGCCAADITDDGEVDADDLHELEIRWGQPFPRGDLDGSGFVDDGDVVLLQGFMDVECWTVCPADLNHDWIVDAADRAELEPYLGQDCPDPDDCPFDFNADGTMDGTDLWFLLDSFGPCVRSASNGRGDPPNPCADDPDG